MKGLSEEKERLIKEILAVNDVAISETIEERSSECHQLQVQEQMSDLESQIERLVSLLTTLESRLSSVLRQEEAKLAEPEKEPNLVPLAKRIALAARNIESAGSQVAVMTLHLEL